MSPSASFPDFFSEAPGEDGAEGSAFPNSSSLPAAVSSLLSFPVSFSFGDIFSESSLPSSYLSGLVTYNLAHTAILE